MASAEADLGPIGQLEGRIVGLKAVSDLATVGAAGVTSAWMRQRAAKKPAKDYNDQPTSETVGSENGRSVEWMPKW